MPGLLGWPHPMPKLVSPTRRNAALAPSSTGTTSGPPLSPWQVSTPPSGLPAQIIAALELGRRSLAGPPGERLQIRRASDAAAFLMPRFGSGALEQLGIILLDTKHRVLRTAVLALGTQNSCAVEPRDVFREAAIGGAAAIVIFHTHPSGDPSPSPDDVDLTRRLVAAGVLMGIDVIDHLILGDARYWSMKETRETRTL